MVTVYNNHCFMVPHAMSCRTIPTFRREIPGSSLRSIGSLVTIEIIIMSKKEM
jgi:hypothetical protein